MFRDCKYRNNFLLKYAKAPKKTHETKKHKETPRKELLNANNFYLCKKASIENNDAKDCTIFAVEKEAERTERAR